MLGRDFGMTLDDFEESVLDRSAATADLDREIEVGRGDGRLSTIPEESQVSIDSPEVGALYVQHFEGAPREVQSDLKELRWVVPNEADTEFADVESNTATKDEGKTKLLVSRPLGYVAVNLKWGYSRGYRLRYQIEKQRN